MRPLNRKDIVQNGSTTHFSRWLLIGLIVIGCVVSDVAVSAQAQTPQVLTLVETIELARMNYPAMKETRARAEAAQQAIGVARTAYLPRLDMLWQANRATRNNVFGLVLPQGIVPPISGPVLGTTSSDSVWGSATGMLLSWQAVDFGVRKANMDVARAQTMLTSAQTELTELDVSAAAADAFLTVLASDATVRAAQANVDRLQVFAQSVRTLVQNQLRPGADQSHAEAELAIARNQLSQAIQVSEIARATLSNATGSAGTSVQLDAAVLNEVPAFPAVRAARTDASRGPRRVSRHRRRAGAQPRARQIVSAPRFSARARQRVELQNELAERARYDQVVQNLTTQQARARALMTAAADIARNTPLERQAATDAESSARARYSNGLANITEVAEAQRLLAQAEADDAVARLAAWRVLLAAAQARGDLTPFIERIRQP